MSIRDTYIVAIFGKVLYRYNFVKDYAGEKIETLESIFNNNRGSHLISYSCVTYSDRVTWLLLATSLENVYIIINRDVIRIFEIIIPFDQFISKLCYKPSINHQHIQNRDQIHHMRDSQTNFITYKHHGKFIKETPPEMLCTKMSASFLALWDYGIMASPDQIFLASNHL